MRILVSSTSKDLKEYRLKVRDAILGQGHHPIMMEYMGAGKRTPKEESLNKVKESDVFIGIYAHRYGFIPPGEEISITELEYRQAVKEKKEIFCFIINEEYEWPAEGYDNDPRLKKLLDEIKEKHVVDFFTTTDNLALLIVNAISSLKERLVDPIQKRAEKIDERTKLRLIDQLVVENSQRRLTDQALKSTLKLIASNFKKIGLNTPLKLIEYTCELLEGTFPFDPFVAGANDLAREVTTVTTKIQRYKDEARKILWPALIFLVIGLALGVSSYRWNWFGARSKYLAGKNANPMDVIDWLINEKVENNIVMNNYSDPRTIRALDAMRFAYELEPESPKIVTFFNKIINDARRNTRDPRTPVHTLQNYTKVLEDIYKFVPYHPLDSTATKLRDRSIEIVNRTNAKKMLDNLNQDINNASISDTTLVRGFQGLQKLYQLYLKKEENIPQKIKNFENLFNEYKKQLLVVKSDTTVILEKISLLKQFLTVHQRESPEKAEIQNEIVRLEQLAGDYSIIAEDDNFITCRSVSKQRNPIGISETFSPGNVMVWARIKAPRSERIRFDWFSNGKKFHTTRASVATAKGYRVYYGKSYSGKSGKGEIRLYNSQNILIGRRSFKVTGTIARK